MAVSDQEAKKLVQAAVREALAEAKKPKSPFDKLDVPVEHEGRAIKLPSEPAKMSLEKAVEALQRKIADENQEFQFFEIFQESPFDAAVAFVRAMNKLYGFASAQDSPGFFGPEPPVMLPIKTGPHDDDVLQCPMGKFKLPGVASTIDSGMTPYQHKSNEDRRLTFYISSKAKKKDSAVLQELATETRRFLREQSIYRGKPIRMGVSEDGELDMRSPPEFMDVSEMTEEDILFDQDIHHQLDTNILVPLRETETCRKHKIPLKRGILLSGKYGTGKSLMARLTARVAEVNGWTFVLLDRVQGLRAALEFANRYAPAVVFAEDIDRVAEDRDEATNDLINIIDGVVSKRADIMTVLTTNHVEKLNPVILRPGRLDAVITLRAPNAETAARLIRHYAGDLLPAEETLERAGKELDGQIPATIRECVERAKLGMIGRRANALAESDFVVAAQTMKNHLDLLNRPMSEETHAEKLAASLKAVLKNGEARLMEMVEEIHDHVT